MSELIGTIQHGATRTLGSSATPQWLRRVLCWSPLLYPLSVHLFAEMHGAELVVLATTPFLIAAMRRDRISSSTILILIVGLCWLGAQVLSDTINLSPSTRYLRGWAKIGVFLVLFHNFRRVFPRLDRSSITLGFLLSVGFFLDTLLSPSKFAATEVWGNRWKFGFAYPVTLFFFAWATIRPQQALRLRCLGLLLSLLHVAMGSRSWGLNTALGTALLDRPQEHKRWARLVQGTLLLLVFANLFVSVLALDLGGKGALQNHQRQMEGTLGPLTGRGEVVVGLMAALDRPWFGHGSWAENPYYARYRYNHLGGQGSYPDSDLIPSHSHLVGAWVEAGLVGALFWTLVFCLVARRLWQHLSGATTLAPIQLLAAILLLWDILFSPFGFERRYFNAVLLTLVLAETAMAIRPNATCHRPNLATRSDAVPISAPVDIRVSI